MNPLLEPLSDTVRAAGRALMEMRGTERARGRWQGTQLKIPADEAIHTLLAANLSLVTNVPVISEEDVRSHAARRPDRYWLIDPIDGTASFSGGFDGFVTQAALMSGGIPVLAAIYAPALDLFYTADLGSGSSLNGERLGVSGDVNRRILIDNYPAPTGIVKAVYDTLRCTGYVESGSIALKICRVADSTADLFFKAVTVRDWDVAPAQLVLEESGGVLTGPGGTPFCYRGPFDKSGLVAARSSELNLECARVLEAAAFGQSSSAT